MDINDEINMQDLKYKVKELQEKNEELQVELDITKEQLILYGVSNSFAWEEVEEFGRKAFYDGREVERYNENGLAIFKRPTYNGYLREFNSK